MTRGDSISAPTPNTRHLNTDAFRAPRLLSRRCRMQRAKRPQINCKARHRLDINTNPHPDDGWPYTLAQLRPVVYDDMFNKSRARPCHVLFFSATGWPWPSISSEPPDMRREIADARCTPTVRDGSERAWHDQPMMQRQAARVVYTAF